MGREKLMVLLVSTCYTPTSECGSGYIHLPNPHLEHSPGEAAGHVAHPLHEYFCLYFCLSHLSHLTHCAYEVECVGS